MCLTEDWCGDAMLNNPVLLRIAEAANMEVRFVLRDQNLELMDQYLTNGTSRAIPIFIFIDQEGNEVGVWGPRAPEIQALVEKGRAELPDKDAPDFQEKQLAFYKSLGTTYQTDPSTWQTVANSIIPAFHIKYLRGYALFIWEVVVNIKAHVNLAMVYSFQGNIDDG